MVTGIDLSLYSNLRRPMSIKAKQLRTINIDGIRYGWRSGGFAGLCAFREGTSNKALRIHFPNAYSGIGHRDGWVIVQELGLSFNLHRPRTAAALIRRALELGWSSNAPMIVEDGYAFISKLPTPVLGDIAELQFYEEYVERFANAPEPGLQKLAADALVRRGIALDRLERYEEEMQTYDELMSRFGNHLEPEIRAQVARSLVKRGVVLSRLNHRDEAMRNYTEVLRRFRDDPEPAVREIVNEAWSKLNPPIRS